jgi:hypothetical protein
MKIIVPTTAIPKASPTPVMISMEHSNAREPPAILDGGAAYSRRRLTP